MGIAAAAVALDNRTSKNNELFPEGLNLTPRVSRSGFHQQIHYSNFP